MPPKAVKRGAASAGSKRNPKSTRGASKSQNPPAEPVEEVANVKETSVPVVGDREEEKEDAIEAGKVVEKSTVEQKVVIEAKGVVEEENTGLNLSSKGSDAMKKENESKESIEEYEKDERLELDDNETEYDASLSAPVALIVLACSTYDSCQQPPAHHPCPLPDLVFSSNLHIRSPSILHHLPTHFLHCCRPIPIGIPQAFTFRSRHRHRGMGLEIARKRV